MRRQGLFGGDIGLLTRCQGVAQLFYFALREGLSALLGAVPEVVPWRLSVLGLEGKPGTHLDSTRIGNTPVPIAETRAGNVGGKGSAVERMEIPHIEEFETESHMEAFGNADVVGYRKVLIVISITANVGDRSTHTGIEVEGADRLERANIKQGIQPGIGIVAALACRERSGSRQDARITAHGKLRGDVAGAGGEHERYAVLQAHDRADLPAADKPIDYSSLVQELAALAKRYIVGKGKVKHLGHVVSGDPVVPVLLVRRNTHVVGASLCEFGGGHGLGPRVIRQQPEAVGEALLGRQLQGVIV